MEQIMTTYFLVKFDALDVAQDFAKMISRIENLNGFVISSISEGHVTVTKEGINTPIDFSISDFQSGLDKSSHGALQVTFDKTNSNISQLFRILALENKYRVFYPDLGCYLPGDSDLLDVNQLVPSEKVGKIFRIKQFKPIYLLPDVGVQYCVSLIDNSVHIINPGLFKYLHEFDVDESSTPELSYKVADNIKQFSALYDEDLIPTNFYRYYQREMKIINYSYMDIRHPDRKIFIKPYFHVYNEERQAFEPMTSDNSALSFADKIRLGETIEQSLIRIVKDELQLGPDYFRAKVGSYVSFDRDRENILTPLIHVDIYFQSLNIDQNIKDKSQRGWVSIDKTKN
jgi:hypothetical protein